MNFNKRGANVAQYILGFLALLIIIALGIAGYGATQDGGFANKFRESVDSVFGVVFTDMLAPLFTVMLGLEGEGGNIGFLMVLTFILMTIVIVGTLDAAKMFGEDAPGRLTNLAIGVIISIIGVRFMPSDLWGALTAPSSAFVATILMAIPFGTLFYVTMVWVKNGAVRKVMWIFLIVFMSYLIFFPSELAADVGQPTVGENRFKGIYLAFLGLSILMLLGEGFVRRYIFKESAKASFQKTLDLTNTEELIRIQKRIKKLMDDRAGAGRNRRMLDIIDREIIELKEDYRRISGEIYDG